MAFSFKDPLNIYLLSTLLTSEIHTTEQNTDYEIGLKIAFPDFMNIAIAIWPEEKAGWIELILDTIEDTECVLFSERQNEISELLSFDLIVLDPDHCGPQFIEKYENLIAHCGTIPLIIFGNKNHSILKKISWKPTHVLFIPKPFSCCQLELRLSTAIKKLRAHQQKKNFPERPNSNLPVNRPLDALKSLDPKDIIQMLCLSRWNGRVEVTSQKSNRRGQLFLSYGEIVHAIFEGHDGLEACITVLSWQECSYVFDENDISLIESIQMQWEPLLLEASRQQDQEKLNYL